ncbi:MAG: LytTR family transcriptional regulator DNA-binding domain-containing protein [Cytophagales bacterium]|nr:LytTR family transcriptional regulator DNA-binding domain-containing protein [Cytophagales bacterium]
MTTISAIIIDDEPLARDLIRQYLTEFPWIELVEECGDGFQGLKAIQEKQPDLVFLDVQMPKITGFELLELLENPPVIIFTTAYNEFAIKAFEMNAVDYLLKPFAKERFRQAIEKAKLSIHSKKEYTNNLIQLQRESMPLGTEKLLRVVVKNGAKIHVMPVSEIIYIAAEDDYVMIHTQSAKYLKQQTMKHFENALDTSLFVRIHRSYMVNIDYISQLEQYEKESYRLILKNKEILPVSKSGHSILKQVLGV